MGLLMRKLLFIFILSYSFLAYSQDRFDSENEKIDKTLTDFYAILENIRDELSGIKLLNQLQYDTLLKICEVTILYDEISYHN